jgi:hypothetical protein
MGLRGVLLADATITTFASVVVLIALPAPPAEICHARVLAETFWSIAGY